MAKGFTQAVRIVGFAGVLALAACGPRPHDSAFLNRGGPEALLDVSSEAVNLNIATKQDIDALSKWVVNDAPSRAELECDLTAKNCKDAVRVLEKKGVDVSVAPGLSNMATLVYERILARDCNQRHRDAQGRYYNQPQPALGCSLSANIVQHVSDKSVFINPGTMDVPRATSAVAAVSRMSAERTAPSAYGVEQGLVNAAGNTQ